MQVLYQLSYGPVLNTQDRHNAGRLPLAGWPRLV